MKQFDQVLLKRFVKRAAEVLTGEWVLIGGTVLPLVGIDERVTVDIDLVRLDSAGKNGGNEDTLRLMDLAQELGLPIEAINQAGAYFLSKQGSFQDDLIPLARSKTVTIYRPNATLFIRLKISRLSETDLQDCLSFIEFAVTAGEEIRVTELKALIKKVSRTETQENRIGRLNLLKAALEQL